MAKNKKTLNQKPTKAAVPPEQNTDKETIGPDDKIKELESKLLTSLADNENLRKRFDREIQINLKGLIWESKVKIFPKINDFIIKFLHNTA